MKIDEKEICGCGRPTRYMTPFGYACNKYKRCNPDQGDIKMNNTEQNFTKQAKTSIVKLFAIMMVAIGFALPQQAAAATFWQGGVLYGNVCRAGTYYIILPFAPVGTPCYIDYAGVRWHGAITTE